MKKILLICTLLLAIVLSFAACGGNNNPPSNEGNDNETPAHTHSFGEWDVNVKPTCTENGTKVRYCSCGEKQSETVAMLGHTPADAVIEDKIDATCEADGSYNEVVRCSTCDEKLSETSHTIPMLKHTPSEAVTENVVDATCYSEGSYDTVVYCSDCGAELERTVHTVEKVAHTIANVVEENVVESTCYSTGSKDMVIYCYVSDCHAEIERNSVSIDKKAHTPASAVEENRVNPTYENDGSYQMVVYCSVAECHAELERTTNMSHAEYIEAEMDTFVVIEAYVQATHSWWNNKITAFLQDRDGAYFVYEMSCSEEDAAKLVPGTKIRVTGYKYAWEGEVEIIEANFTFVDEADTFIATPADLTDILANEEELIKHQNEYAIFNGLTVESIEYKFGEPGNDIYVTVKQGDKIFDFHVERYLTDPDTEVYKAFVNGNINVGDVVNITGFVYWYNGVCTQITSITVAG